MTPRPTRPVRRPAAASAVAATPVRTAHPVAPSPDRTAQRSSRSVGSSSRPAQARAVLAGYRSPRAVSTGSVRRYAERARAVRLPRRRPLLLTLGALGLLLGLSWVVLFSPLLTARTVQLVGAERLAAADVEPLVAPELGQPLATVDTGSLEGLLMDLPAVDDVIVLRVWPSTVEVRITERVPVVAVPVEGGFALVDAEGVTVDQEVHAPPDLPLVSVATARAGDDALLAAAQVLDQLPAEIRTQVAGTEALTQDSVTLTLRSNATVVWGSPEETPRKAEVLRVLLQRAAVVYDVSAPGTPVTR